MNLIFNVLGTPSKSDMSFISNDKALDYIKSLEKRPKIPFSKIYPDANPLGASFSPSCACVCVWMAIV